MRGPTNIGADGDEVVELPTEVLVPLLTVLLDMRRNYRPDDKKDATLTYSAGVLVGLKMAIDAVTEKTQKELQRVDKKMEDFFERARD